MSLMEITMKSLQDVSGGQDGQIDLRDFLARVDVLAACGTTVLISNYFEYYRLAAYLTTFTNKMIGITMGAASLWSFSTRSITPAWRAASSKRSAAFSRTTSRSTFIRCGCRLTGELTTVQNMKIAPPLRKLYDYLMEKGCMANWTTTILPIYRFSLVT